MIAIVNNKNDDTARVYDGVYGIHSLAESNHEYLSFRAKDSAKHVQVNLNDDVEVILKGGKIDG